MSSSSSPWKDEKEFFFTFHGLVNRTQRCSHKTNNIEDIFKSEWSQINEIQVLFRLTRAQALMAWCGTAAAAVAVKEEAQPVPEFAVPLVQPFGIYTRHKSECKSGRWEKPHLDCGNIRCEMISQSWRILRYPTCTSNLDLEKEFLRVIRGIILERWNQLHDEIQRNHLWLIGTVRCQDARIRIENKDGIESNQNTQCYQCDDIPDQCTSRRTDRSCTADWEETNISLSEILSRATY